MRSLRQRLLCALGMAAVAAATLGVSPTPSMAADPFYKGKTIKVVIRSSAGGGYDWYGRLLARHMPKYIPGKPRTVVINMPGAGGIVATNYIAQRAKRDGTEILVPPRAYALSQRLGTKGAKFDTRTLPTLGSAAREAWVWVVGKNVPIDNLEAMKKSASPVKLSVTGPGSDSYQKAILLASFGYPVKVITGYSGTSEKVLAVARGEVEGTNGSYGSLRTAIRDEGFKIIAKLGNDPDLKDIADVREFLPPKGKSLANLMAAPLLAGRPFVTAPGVPKDRVEILRTAFKKALSDPQLLAEAKRAKKNIGWTGSAELDKMYDAILKAPDDVIAMFKAK